MKKILVVTVAGLVGIGISWLIHRRSNSRGGQNENEENEDGGDGMNAQQHEDCPPPEPQEQAQDEVSLDEDMVMEEVAEDEQLDKDPVVAMMPKKKIFVPLGIADLKSDEDRRKTLERSQEYVRSLKSRGILLQARRA